MTAEDLTPEQAYDLIADIGRKHALIYQAAGGFIVVVHPDTQREEGLYEHIQYVHCLGPHPSQLEKS